MPPGRQITSHREKMISGIGKMTLVRLVMKVGEQLRVRRQHHRQ